VTGFGSCVRLLIRTGWKSLLTIPLVLVALLAALAGQMVARYPTQLSRETYAAAYHGIGSGTTAFQGRGYNLTNLGGMLANEMGFLALVFFPVAGILLAVRHTRAVEDAGQLDILTAGRIGRGTALAAGATVVILAALLTGVLSSGLLLALGYPVRGSLLYSFALALFLLTFAAIGLVAAQLAQTAPQAYGLALSVFGVVYLLRAVLDVRHRSETWSNPESWLAEIRPFADRPVAWPWAAFIVSITVLAAAGAWIAGRRDLGAGVLTSRPGPTRAPLWTSSPAGLLLRLTRGSALAWLIGSGVVALAFSLLAGDVQDLMAKTKPGLVGTALDTLVALYAQVNALFAGAVGVQSAIAWSREERSGRLGWVLSTSIGRQWSWAGAGAVAVGWSLLTLVWTGLLTGIGLRFGLHQGAEFSDGLSATLAYVPAAVFVTAAALLLGAMAPAAAPIGWVLVIWGLVVTFLGDPLGLSQGLRDLSPFEWSGQLPLEAWARVPALATAIAALLALLLSALVFVRRDLTRG
jgi:ABC-2 type transport system permease protein